MNADLSELPRELRASVVAHLKRLESKAEAARIIEAHDIAASLPKVWACSEFVARYCLRYPESFAELATSGALSQAWHEQDWAETIERFEAIASEEEMLKALRIFRNREMVRIAWRDLAGWADLDETLAALSKLADVCIAAALRFGVSQLSPRFGVPRNRRGQQQSLIVLGMGKLGGGELNFSSDIDLVFLYRESGETDGTRRLSNEEYFKRLGQLLIRLLDRKSEDGIVFRVDMRLRPFGDSGPLAVSYSAFELYLQQHGREWERYAYIKARAVTGDAVDTALYEEILRPFVYRRYLDYGVFESLREMKALIAREVERRDLRNNIKLGRGGIREVEFIAQAFQLIRGGTISRLRRRELQKVLSVLPQVELLPDNAAKALIGAYRFLRRLENRLQEYADQQCHDLPEDPLAQSRLALAMGYADWPKLGVDLEKHQRAVNEAFEEIVFGERAEADDGFESTIRLLWERGLDDQIARKQLAATRTADSDAVLAFLSRLREGVLYRRLDQTGQSRLTALIPRLVRAARGLDEAPLVLPRLATIIEAVGRRTAYFALMNENPAALERLTEICARSDFLVGQIAAHPLLLDELLDPRIFDEPPSREEFERELAERFADIASSDMEHQVDALRVFQRAAVFRVAIADLGGKLPLMKVSDRLTDIAELVLERALSVAWSHLVVVHGEPCCGSGPDRRRAGFAIVAYGKLGGIELGYGSDLDLVFVHDSSGDDQTTAGPRIVDNGVFFARLARRLTHLLTIQTSSGVLYEVDTRLRPSGNAGLLVTSLGALSEYQRGQAWTWEHQALLRARAVAGDSGVREGFEEIRRDVLRNHVRRETLREDVRQMRQRMRDELSKSTPGAFDIKQDPGGVADIEFLVQYWVLESCDEYPELLRYSDNIRQLEGLVRTGCIPGPIAEFLTDAYRTYRQRLHHMSLGGGGTVVDEQEFAMLKERILDIWRDTMEA